MSEHPLVKVARDLTQTLALYADLREQAEHKATSHLMPGGEAMVDLGPVANIEAWNHMQDATERYHRAYTSEVDEDPDEAWTAYQLIEFWSEAWRRELGAEYEGHRTTIATEATFVRSALEWAWQNEPQWVDFARDMDRARRRLETVLYAGERAQRGVPCLYDECGGERLVRRMEPYRNSEGGKAWRWSDWHCPRCHRQWDEDKYAQMVTAAHEATKTEAIDGEEWCAPELAARRVGRSHSTIRQWVHLGKVATVCLIRGQRAGFVRMSDVEELDRNTARRKGAA